MSITTAKKMTKQQNIILISAGISLTICLTLIIIFYERMKQSIQGAITGNYFSDRELTYSAKAKENGIDNTPDEATLANLHRLRDNILNPAREKYGSCIYVNCGYRSPALNALIKNAAAGSQHQSGNAADIDTRSREGNQKLFAILMEMDNYDQLIWEGNGEWIHVSYDPSRDRRKVLAQNNDGKTYRDIKNNWQEQIA